VVVVEVVDVVVVEVEVVDDEVEDDVDVDVEDEDVDVLLEEDKLVEDAVALVEVVELPPPGSSIIASRSASSGSASEFGMVSSRALWK